MSVIRGKFEPVHPELAKIGMASNMSEPKKRKSTQNVMWVLCSVVCVGLLGMIWGDWGGYASRLNTQLQPKPAIGGEFSLTSTNGATLTHNDILGTPTALFFGYTYCPDVCPTTLYEATNWLQKLGPDADKVQILFVTVDPQRDTLEHLTSYMSAFDPRIIGLTGTQAEIDRIVSAYKAYAERVPPSKGDDASAVDETDDAYLMNHTASIYLLGKDGQFVDTIPYQENETKALEKLRFLIRP